MCVLVCRITFTSAGCSASVGNAIAQGVSRGLLLRRRGFVPRPSYMKGALGHDSVRVNCFFHINISTLVYSPIFIAFIASYKLRAKLNNPLKKYRFIARLTNLQKFPNLRASMLHHIIVFVIYFEFSIISRSCGRSIDSSSKTSTECDLVFSLTSSVHLSFNIVF
jgi:hypothetical protein